MISRRGPQLPTRLVSGHGSKVPSPRLSACSSNALPVYGTAEIMKHGSGALLQPQYHQRSGWATGQCRRQQQRRQQGRHAASTATAAAAAAGDPSSSTAAGIMHQQQQPQAAAAQPEQLGHIDLPPSQSAAAWLNNLSETQLQQQAQDWGYLQLGRPLPEGLSLTAIADTMPDEHFKLDLVRAVGYLALSVAVMAAGYAYLWYWHSICPWWQQLACWLVIGTGYFGVFQSAVDCAHFAFWPQRPAVQDVLGAALMAPALISYEVFRLKYFNHLM